MKRSSSRRLSTPKRLRGAASVDVDRDGTPGKRARSEPPRLSAAVESLIAELEGKPPAGHVKAFKISDAVRHIASADGGRLQCVISRCGAPPFYHRDQEGPTGDTFRSLARIIVGQQLAGAAVKAIWAKFLAALDGDVTPAAVLAQSFEMLRAAAGLSGAKCRAIFDLAAHYEKGSLSDSILLDPELSEADLSSKLLAVKGIGPWSAHMYQMFSLHLPDVFPTGDLGVRNGMAKAFGLRGSAKSGGLDEKKDMEKLLGAMEPYRPYRAVASWYMWRVCETPSFME